MSSWTTPTIVDEGGFFKWGSWHKRHVLYISSCKINICQGSGMVPNMNSYLLRWSEEVEVHPLLHPSSGSDWSRSAYPSSLSAHHGFLRPEHFKQANEWLRENDRDVINWTVLDILMTAVRVLLTTRRFQSSLYIFSIVYKPSWCL